MKPNGLRADGFAGQRLVVVPKPVWSEAGRHPLLQSLIVTDAGYFPEARGHFVERPRGTPTHLLIACLRGHGWILGTRGKQTVNPGDLVWWQADQPQAYGADPAEPWSISWAHFRGTEAEAWRRHIGFPDEAAAVLRFGPANALTALKLEQIHLALEQGYSIPELIGTSNLLRAALELAAQAVRVGGTNRSSAERIAAVREHLRENLAQAHRVDELAASAGLCVPHFSALFRRQTGYAPIDFLIRQRMQRACQLLDTTDRPVAAIASEVGYEDAYYFTRCFRRVVGCPPRTYRKTQKG